MLEAAVIQIPQRGQLRLVQAVYPMQVGLGSQPLATQAVRPADLQAPQMDSSLFNSQ